MDLREVAGELYGAAPAEFVQRRSEAAAGAERALAKEIRAFRKPTAAAAAVNALVRERPEAVEDVLDIGDRMRAAFADRDRQAIRELTRERQRLLQRATRGLGLSPAVEREVEETLQAAVVDPAAAAAVRSGMLLRALESTGVEEVDVSDAVALPVDVDASSGAARPARRARVERATEEEAAPAERESASERRERQRRIRTAEKALERARRGGRPRRRARRGGRPAHRPRGRARDPGAPAGAHDRGAGRSAGRRAGAAQAHRGGGRRDPRRGAGAQGRARRLTLTTAAAEKREGPRHQPRPFGI